MTQLDLFNPAKGLARKEEALTNLEHSRRGALEAARKVAVQVAKIRGSCSADDVYKNLITRGWGERALGNAAGAIFRGKDWEPCGWVQSKRVSNNGRMIRLWRLAG